MSRGERAFKEAYSGMGLAERNGHKPGAPSWPVLNPEALYGLPGDIVRTIEPHSEADPVALLANLLVGFGNAAGRGSHFQVGADRHHLNLNAALVGETSKGRKGSSWGFIADLLRATARAWAEERILNGLSSGEGLLNEVRDRVVVDDGDGEPEVIDEGAPDKRLLIVEGEFAGTLKVMTREGNTLSPLIRQAWDGGKLATLTRNSPLKATEAHLSIIGHITKAELLKKLSQTDTEGGFTNRFLWLMVRRSKALPFGGQWHEMDAAPLVRRLQRAIEFGQHAGEITWGESAREVWTEVYEPLSEGKPGLFGAAASRAEAQAMRLAMVYAVMDCSRTIEREHLEAALALWQYAEDSARYIFGDATGDKVADKIVAALKEEPEGLARTDIIHLFKRNVKQDRIDQALTLLQTLGLVRCEQEETGGRPAERWFLA